MTNIAVESKLETPDSNLSASDISVKNLTVIATRWWNRFMLLEVILYFIPSSFYTFPFYFQKYGTDLTDIFVWPWNQLAKILWGRDTIFDISHGAGDYPGGYFYLFITLIFSIIAAIIWTLLEKNHILSLRIFRYIFGKMACVCVWLL